MKTFPISRFLFAKLTSEFKSSEISAIIHSVLPFNPRVKIASPHYYLFYHKDEGLFFGKKIIGLPTELPANLIYRDFGGEKIKSFKGGRKQLSWPDTSSFHVFVKELSDEFDQKIEKMIIVIDTQSWPEDYTMEIFVE